MTADPLAIDAVILCGGLGTRLRSVVADRPKPLADVGGRPFLELLMERAAAQGAGRFILATGYGAAAIRERFQGRPGVSFSEEPRPLGTGGALKLCEPLCESDPVLVMNGDSLCELDLRRMLEFHREKGGVGTIALAPRGERSDGGIVALEPDGRVRSFEERGAGAGGLINAGVYALSREALAEVPPGVPCSLEREVFPRLLARGLYGFAVAGPLFDIGTPERLELFRSRFRPGASA